MQYAGLTFALPPSMGLESLRPVARHLAEMLSDFGFSTVWPCKSYEELERALASGEAQVGWAPPAVAARLEGLGGEVLYRAVRMGASSYRSALLCRGERAIDLKRLDAMTGLAPIRAAWVDRRSVAGYLMPRAYLRAHGANLEVALREQLLGSYRACFDAVLEGDADLTATYVGRRGAGYIDLCGDYARELRVLAWTDEIPNDGLVLSPAVTGARASEVRAALTAAFGSLKLRARLALAFDADGFEAPPEGSYESIRSLLGEPVIGGDRSDPPADSESSDELPAVQCAPGGRQSQQRRLVSALAGALRAPGWSPA